MDDEVEESAQLIEKKRQEAAAVAEAESKAQAENDQRLNKATDPRKKRPNMYPGG